MMEEERRARMKDQANEYDNKLFDNCFFSPRSHRDGHAQTVWMPSLSIAPTGRPLWGDED